MASVRKWDYEGVWEQTTAGAQDSVPELNRFKNLTENLYGHISHSIHFFSFCPHHVLPMKNS